MSNLCFESCNLGLDTHVLADHVETQILQHLQIVHHCLVIRGRVYSVGPEALVQRTKHEDKFSIEQRPLDAVNHASGNCTEANVTLHYIFA
jgi:hypothetical protein